MYLQCMHGVHADHARMHACMQVRTPHAALHAVHGAQGEEWAPGHLHVGRMGKNIFGIHYLMRFRPLSFGNKQGGTFF